MPEIVAVESTREDGKVKVTDSNGTVATGDLHDLLAAMVAPYGDGTLKVCWNMQEFLAPLMKLLPHETVAKLNHGESAWYEDFKLFYGVGKGAVFGVTWQVDTPVHEGSNIVNREEYESNIYDLHIYFPDATPTTLAEVKERGDELLSTLHSMGIENPTKLTSPAAIFDESVLSKLNLPTIYDMPEAALEMAEWTANYCREWRSAYRVGYFEKAYDYDMSCYSADTECLTYDGWKLVSNLQVGELVMTFSPNSQQSSFQPVLQMHHSNYVGDMYRIESKKTDLLVTPNHRVLVQNHIRSRNSKEFKVLGRSGYASWQVYDANNLPNGNFRIPISFPIVDRTEYAINDDILRIMAWINTEGHRASWLTKTGIRHFGAISISQGDDNKEYCIEIETCLQRLGWKYSHLIRIHPYKHIYPIVKGRIEVERRIGQIEHTFNILARDVQNVPLTDIHSMPIWILQRCSIRQLKLYFDTLLKGDGSQSQHKLLGYTIKTSFYTKRKEFADRMSYLCHLLGYKVNIHPPDTHHSTYQLFIMRNKESPTQRHDDHFGTINYGLGNITVQANYTGIVSCPTTENGYIVVRRNGKSCICGNSAYPSIMSRLPDLRHARYVKTDGRIPADAFWGILKGEVNITGDVSPLVSADGKCYKGKYQDYIGTNDWRTIRKWGIGDFKPEAGWFIIVDKLVPIFDHTMHMLYDLRNEDALQTRLAKNMAALVWGKTIETHVNAKGKVKWGDYYMPPYAAMTTSGVRCKDCDFIYSHQLQDSLVSITVDGCLSTKEAKGVGKERTFGDWRLDNEGPALVLSSSFQWVGDKRPAGVNLNQMLEAIKEHPMSKAWNGVALRLLEHDRDFSSLPNTGHELMERVYESTPMTH